MFCMFFSFFFSFAKSYMKGIVSCVSSPGVPRLLHGAHNNAVITFPRSTLYMSGHLGVRIRTEVLHDDED